jgi:hypothetical protein
LRTSEHKVLRRIFEHKIEKLVGDWRKLHNKQLNNLYSSAHIIRVTKSRRMMWARYVAWMMIVTAYKILDGRPEGKRL